MELMFEQPRSVIEGEDAEKPKGERAPVQRLVIWLLRARVIIDLRKTIRRKGHRVVASAAASVRDHRSPSFRRPVRRVHYGLGIQPYLVFR